MAIIDKITALMNKAKSTDSQAEADAFMSKAQQLMRENNLTDFDLKKHEQSIERIVVNVRGWQKSLLLLICKNNGCSITVRGIERAIIGSTSDIQVCQFLFDFYINCLKSLSENSYKLSDKRQSKASYKSDYCIGGVVGLRERLTREQSEFEKANPQLREIILVKNNAIDEFITEINGGFSAKTQKNTYRPSVNATTYFKGMEDAKGISSANKQLA